MAFPMIAQRVFGTPLLVDPAKGAAFLAGLGPRLVNGALELRGLDGLSEERVSRAGRIGQRASIIGDDVGERARGNGRRLYRVRSGVAVIEVTGTLVHRGDWIGESSGTTSYEGLAAQISAAADDPTVRGIALEIDSYGGEVAGAFDLADLIRSARAKKPVHAFVAEAALSAGYAIASQADRIILPRTGEVGSIGVLCVHADFSQRLADDGVAVTLIHAGAHKVDGNPYEALPEDVRDDMQAGVEKSWRLFAETVAAGRGARLSAADALATEAQVFRGEDALAAGLADDVSDLRSAFAAFVAQVNGSTPTISMAASAANLKGDSTMAKQKAGDPAAEVVAEPEAEVTQDEPQAQDEQSQQGTAVAPPSEAAATISVAQATELVEIGQQASRLGIKVDVADAMKNGMTADALRASILDKAAARGEQVDVVPHTPGPAASKPKESPLVAAVKAAAESQTAARRH